MANIGQAYGGVAAVLAGLALCGVVASIATQRRQLAVQLNLAVRERQFDLTRMLLEHPDATARLFGSSISTEGALLNLHIAQWWLVFDTRAADRASMSAELALVFQTEEARRWWAEGGGPHWRKSHAKRSRAFATIVDEAVELARSWDVANDAAGRESAHEEYEASRGIKKRPATRIKVAAGLLAGAGILWWRCKNR